MKTNELKKMETMEDYSNMYDSTSTLNIDKKKIEIIQKLNLN